MRPSLLEHLEGLQVDAGILDVALVAEHHVEPVGAQAVQRGVAAEADHVHRGLGHALPGALAPVADLADDIDVLADAGQRHAQPLLREAVGDAVGLGGVEQVDAASKAARTVAHAVASSISPHWLPMFHVPRPTADTCQPVLPNGLVT